MHSEGTPHRGLPDPGIKSGESRFDPLNPNGIPAIAQGCRVGEATLGQTPLGDTNRNAVAPSFGIDPHPCNGDGTLCTLRWNAASSRKVQ